MNIKVSWNTGWIEVKGEAVVERMTIPHYLKWVKLFAQYGTPAQHEEFLQFLEPYIGEVEALCADLELQLQEKQMKSDGRLPTVMTQEYWEAETKRYKSKLNGARAKLKRYESMRDYLKGLLA